MRPATGEGARRDITAPLAIVGTGLAGLAAAVYAARRGIPAAIAGHGGALAYTSGYLDLLGRLDPPHGRVDDPWPALQVLRATQPRHPLARLDAEGIRQAFEAFTTFVGTHGIAYTPPGERNLLALTPVGTLKATLCMPRTMAAGSRALAERTPGVIVDVEGLAGFSARECVANLARHWPGLAARRVVFPGLAPQALHPEVMARALEVPSTREAFAAALREAAGDAAVVGLPAILGMHRPDEVHAAVERLVGRPLFEIPTMPPGVPGTRLRELFEDALPRHGVSLVAQHEVGALHLDSDGATLELADPFGPIRIRAQAVILATGRFLGGGLRARPDGIREALLDLPVTQPEGRGEWYREHLADARGHPLNRAGLEVDDTMRPLGRDGRPHHPRLFAAGTLLAHHDAVRSRSGAAVALATAWRAVASAVETLPGATSPGCG